MRKLSLSTYFVPVACLFVIVGVAAAQEQTSKDQSSSQKMPHKMATKQAGLSDAQYIARALTAAPAGVAKDAGVARIGSDGTMQTLRESKNGFTCLIMLGDVMCADANSLAFFDATMKKQTPPEKLGLTYMLRGDQGASNTDPMATG